MKKFDKINVNGIASIVADRMTKLRSEALWSIEDVIYNIVGDNISQNDRILIAGEILTECFNLDMSTAENWGEMYMEIRHILNKKLEIS